MHYFCTFVLTRKPVVIRSYVVQPNGFISMYVGRSREDGRTGFYRSSRPKSKCHVQTCTPMPNILSLMFSEGVATVALFQGPPGKDGEVGPAGPAGPAVSFGEFKNKLYPLKLICIMSSNISTCCFIKIVDFHD